MNLALNVLARGLESNKDCVDLWTYYLTLYRCHGDSSTDYLDLCNTALEYAPCYEIWWQVNFIFIISMSAFCIVHYHTFLFAPWRLVSVEFVFF